MKRKARSGGLEGRCWLQDPQQALGVGGIAGLSLVLFPGERAWSLGSRDAWSWHRNLESP